mmetsp:Transcript_23345/g.42134  ORF Transcript_23345/g.42134 Transcript_23345/m.42134 type:complete len:224 (-) Transcript_23345:49-720(-)
MEDERFSEELEASPSSRSWLGSQVKVDGTDSSFVGKDFWSECFLLFVMLDMVLLLSFWSDQESSFHDVAIFVVTVAEDTDALGRFRLDFDFNFLRLPFVVCVSHDSSSSSSSSLEIENRTDRIAREGDGVVWDDMGRLENDAVGSCFCCCLRRRLRAALVRARLILLWTLILPVLLQLLRLLSSDDRNEGCADATLPISSSSHSKLSLSLAIVSFVRPCICNL